MKAKAILLQGVLLSCLFLFNACELSVTPPSSGNDIEWLSFDNLSPSITSVIKGDTIEAYVAPGTDVTQLLPVIGISEKARISPASGVVQDFTNFVHYTVTAQNGVAKVYTVKVIAGVSNQSVIYNFDTNVEDATVAIRSDNTIRVEVPYGTNVSQISPSILISTRATIFPKSGTLQDFYYPVKYTVTAEDGSTNKYTVHVIYKGADKCEIEDFDIIKAYTGSGSSFYYPTVYASISSGTITLRMENNIPFSHMVPEIKVSKGATVSPESGVSQDFTGTVKYVVTALNGITKEYIVKVETY